MTASARLTTWLAARSPRERTLLTTAAALTAGLGAAVLVLLARDDLAVLRARVAAHERELGEVRRLAATLRRGAAPDAPAAADAPSLLGRLEAAAAETVGRERIASMTPADAATEDGGHDERVALRVSGAALAEVVRLLHRLEAGSPPLAVGRLELRKHPDDPTRFDVTVEVAQGRAAP